MKVFAGLLPTPLVYQLANVGYRILKRTTNSVTKWYSTVHTPCRLLAYIIRRKRHLKLGKIVYVLLDWPVTNIFALIF